MGRKKVFDGRLVPIGAKVTEKQMDEIISLKASLGMSSNSDLLRAALADYLLKHPENIGKNDLVTNQDESSETIRADTRLNFKELEISLKDAITKLEHLNRCSCPDSLAPCSNVDCPKRKRPDNN